LIANDDLQTDFVEDADLGAVHKNINSWLTWNARLYLGLYAQTVLSTSRINQNAYLYKDPNLESEIMGNIDDDRKLTIYGLKQNWNFEISDNYMLKWGIDYKNFRESYDFYFRKELYAANIWDWVHNESDFDTTDVQGGHNGTELGIYLGNRFRIFSPLTAEFGIRYDKASWTEDSNVSPRINFAYNVNKKTTFRAGWGKYY